MKIAFLAEDRNAVSGFFVSHGFSWEEGPCGISSVFMRGVLPFRFEGFVAVDDMISLQHLVIQNNIGVTIEQGILSLQGELAGVLGETLK